MAGWIKSPAHCVLIGFSGIFYWALSGQLLNKIKSPGSWAAALFGVFVCISAYIPIILLDYKILEMPTS